MKWKEIIDSKIYTDSKTLKSDTDKWRAFNDSIVFTNGCFDILHLGHIDYLSKAADLGDRLIIGINTDTSVRKLKGENRPVLDEHTRAVKLASFSFVDAVVYFDEETPLELIKTLSPDVLVKGGDYSIDTIVGAQEVKANGGKVEIIPFLEGHSTSLIIDKITKA